MATLKESKTGAIVVNVNSSKIKVYLREFYFEFVSVIRLLIKYLMSFSIKCER